MTPEHGWDDPLADGVALVAAIRADDVERVAAILPNMSAYEVGIVLARLLAVAADDADADPEQFRDWAERSARR